MRSKSVAVSWLVIIGLSACSSDSSPGGQLGDSAGAGGAESNVGGPGGATGPSSEAGEGGMGAAAASGGMSNSEGMGATELSGEAGNSGSGNPGGVTVDAGEPPAVAGPCPSGPFADDPLPAGATAEAVCSGMTFTEGPVWFQARNTLFFSDFVLGGNAGATVAGGRIMTFTPGGACAEFIENAGTNGLAIAPDGNLLGCRHGDQTLTIFDLMTREPTVLIADNDGVAFNSPNDVAVRSDGNLYFTDPTYLLAGRMSEQPARAYRRDTSGALTIIDEGGNTNGITLSPDETRLYLSHLGGGQSNVLVFDVDASGAVSNPTPFIDVGSDGMAIDCAGNLYITQNGVSIYNPNGDLLETLAVAGAANVAFGGPERRTLYITATDSLFAIELAIPGLPY